MQMDNTSMTDSVNNEMAVEENTVEVTTPVEAAPQVETAPVVPEVESAGLHTQLSEAFKDNKALQDFKDVDGLAKSYLHLNSMIGKKVTDLSADELTSVMGTLGKPEEASGYKMPDSMNPEFKEWYTKLAFDTGLTQDQAHKLAGDYMDKEQSIFKGIEEAKDKQSSDWEAQTRKDFGNALDERLEVAKRAIEAFGGADLRDALTETGMGNHPAMVKAFAQIGKEMLEDSFTASEAGAQFGVTPGEAAMEINTLKRDPDFMAAYIKGEHPGHKAAVEKINRLYEVKHGV